MPDIITPKTTIVQQLSLTCIWVNLTAYESIWNKVSLKATRVTVGKLRKHQTLQASTEWGQQFLQLW